MKREYDFSRAERDKFRRASSSLRLPAGRAEVAWAGRKGPLGRFVNQEADKTLNAYRAQPHLVAEHANQEHDTAHGGYAHRQLYELVQNAADALSHENTGQSILIRLTERFLYCADDGKSIDEEGIKGLMFAHMSSKRDTSEIGRFGMGFKSVLGVTDGPEFFSRSGSIRFDRNQAAERIGCLVPEAERYPALRLPELINPHDEAVEDDDLREFMSWATNIVRLPLKANAFEDLAAQIGEFPPEFLLFVPHVRYLTLECSSGESREFTLCHEGEELELDTGEGSSRWRCWETTHTLSAAANEDSRTLDDTGDVRIAWSAPLGALSEPGRFWAFFPTQTASLLAGILNAPWKTNEDRQNLLPGPYNDELIDAAAKMVADALPLLRTRNDPARHLDALPRREEAGDGTHSKRLRESLLAAIDGRAIVPDQDGLLRAVDEIHYAPEELTSSRVVREPLDRWQSCEHRPSEWAHHATLTRNRLARLNELFGAGRWRSRRHRSFQAGAPRATLSDWLLALIGGWPEEDPVGASKAAIQVASLIPRSAREEPQSLGSIVMAQSGDWRSLDSRALFLPALPFSAEDQGIMDERLVHVGLATDEQVADDLRQLGLREISAERTFGLFVSALPSHLDENTDERWWQEFWMRARSVDVDTAASMLRGKEHQLRFNTMSGDWCHMDSVLLPGDIVPADGSRDANVAIDTDFHADDLDLQRKIGLFERPGEKDVAAELWFDEFLWGCRRDYKSLDLPQNPQDHLLQFESTRCVGPLQVLTSLSDEGSSRYVDALLGVDGSYRDWFIGHRTRGDVYPKASCRSPVLTMIELYGRIRCAGGFANFGDALGQTPKDPRARRALLAHPRAERIRAKFELAEPRFEAIGEEDPVPFADVWPGVPAGWSRYNLVRCRRIVCDDGGELSCARKDSNVLLVGTGNDAEDIRLVAEAVGAGLDSGDIDAILRFIAHDEVERRRASVRGQSTDAAKLLCAVGEEALKRHLPLSLVSALETTGDALVGINVAEAAIATFHTGALFEYRWELDDDLAPPSRWAGSRRAVEFVQSLGFAPEWAGERRARRAPFVEVEGPYSLPELHGYQQHIVGNVVNALQRGRTNGTGRGMISLPTGAGKTRVTVQAIVQAIRDGIYTGGVLWVADRDELCEQAVEAWRQVWSGMGAAATPLRISRMWDQQPPPVATNELHVVVATIQTLYAKLSRDTPAYRFISDFSLVVFDEAHRSVAPSYTSVMEEIGFTRWRRQGEPFLLGLTATPYRGHDQRETTRLVNRYGSNRLDSGAFSGEDPISAVAELQEMGVLAQADHKTISGGSFSLSKDEVAEIEAMPRPAWLPRSVEQRIASDTKRTLGIVDAYQFHVADRNADWPTLIFATSVEHAQTVAALLNTRGVTARAVSGGTDRAVRRRVVDDFRSGKVQALVNYGVFREGFDAPKTRAILVARPVYSPNLYFQMIGRGLRGPKNGGSERCLVINVQDNIDNFNKQLAFADLDWLWA